MHNWFSVHPLAPTFLECSDDAADESLTEEEDEIEKEDETPPKKERTKEEAMSRNEKAPTTQSPEKTPTFLRLSTLHHKLSSFKTIKINPSSSTLRCVHLKTCTVEGLFLSQSMSHYQKYC